MQSEPAEIRLVAFEQTCHRIDQQRKRGTPADAAGMTERQGPPDPAIALFAICALASLKPQHAESVGPLRHIVCGFDTGHVQEYPQ